MAAVRTIRGQIGGKASRILLVCLNTVGVLKGDRYMVIAQILVRIVSPSCVPGRASAEVDLSGIGRYEVEDRCSRVTQRGALGGPRDVSD